MEGPSSGLRVEKVPLNTVKYKSDAHANSSVNLFRQRVRALETGLILFGPMVFVTFMTTGLVSSVKVPYGNRLLFLTENLKPGPEYWQIGTPLCP